MPIDSRLFKKAHVEDTSAKNDSPTESDDGTFQFGDAGPKEGMGFQDMLNTLDGLIVKESGINSFNIDLVRGYVRQIMTDLKTSPDLDALLIDRDVHNVLAFIQHVKNDAIAAKVTKKEKKEAKAKKGRLVGLKFGASDLPSGLADLAKLK